jgi:hypothetical protein
MSFVLRNAPPSSSQKKEREKFPPKTFAVGFLAAACLYYYVVYVLPGVAAGGSSLAEMAVSLGKLARAQPLVPLLVLAVAFLPAVLKRYGVRAYIIRLAALFIILLGGLYIVAEQPLDRVEAKVQGALNWQREMPH